MAVSDSFFHLLEVTKDYWVLIVLSFFVLRAFKRRYLSPVSDVPALNFLSTISRLGKVQTVLSGHNHHTQLAAHRKHGEYESTFEKHILSRRGQKSG